MVQVDGSLKIKNEYDPSLIYLIRRDYLLPPSTYNYNLSTDPTYQNNSKGAGWKNINDVLKILFDKEYSKFFVEAGGLDGEFLSNTLWLEQTRKWTGLLVEPEAQNFREMVWKRRKCWIANSCLSRTTHPKSVVMVAMEENLNKTGQNSEIIRGGTHELGSNRLYEWYLISKKQVKMTTFTSQCFPLYSFLLALNQTTIDFLSLDIQGAEVDVFDTIPLNKVYVRAVVIEHEKAGFDYKLVKKMNQKGFKILAAGGAPDYFFVNEKENSLIQSYIKSNLYLQDLVDQNYSILYAG